MTGYDRESVARSIRRYFSGLLPQPWNVMLERIEVKDDQRPAGLIEVGEIRGRDVRASVPQGEITEFAPVTMTLWPAVQSGAPPVPLSVPVAGRNARLIEQGVRDMIVVGAEDAAVFVGGVRDGRDAAGPLRMPLWDYSARNHDQAGPANPIDVLWVEDHSVTAIQDPLDARRWAVIAEMRISWERPGREQKLGAPITNVPPLPGSFGGVTPPP